MTNEDIGKSVVEPSDPECSEPQDSNSGAAVSHENENAAELNVPAAEAYKSNEEDEKSEQENNLQQTESWLYAWHFIVHYVLVCMPYA